MKAFLFALVVFASAVGAAPFADPTRPPSAPADAPVAPGATPAGPRLESVLIAPDRRLAVISGRQVVLGGKFGEGRVVRITETEVAIREGGTTQVLRLFPEAQRRTKGQRAQKNKVVK